MQPLEEPPRHGHVLSSHFLSTCQALSLLGTKCCKQREDRAGAKRFSRGQEPSEVPWVRPVH